MTESVAERASGADTVELTVPADAAYVAVLRTVTATLAARRDFTLDEIDDLRIAVDEASALLLPHAQPESQLSASFASSERQLEIVVAVAVDRSTPASAVDVTSFAWMVLAALADSLDVHAADGRLTLTLAKTRGARD